MKELPNVVIAQVDVLLTRVAKEPVASRKRPQPVQMFYKDRMISTSSGRKRIWNGTGPARNALRCHLNHFVKNIMSSQFRFESYGYYSDINNNVVTSDDYKKYEEALWEHIFKSVEFRPLVNYE